jgi:hypothetical protein
VFFEERGLRRVKQTESSLRCAKDESLFSGSSFCCSSDSSPARMAVRNLHPMQVYPTSLRPMLPPTPDRSTSAMSGTIRNHAMHVYPTRRGPMLPPTPVRSTPVMGAGTVRNLHPMQVYPTLRRPIRPPTPVRSTPAMGAGTTNSFPGSTGRSYPIAGMARTDPASGFPRFARTPLARAYQRVVRPRGHRGGHPAHVTSTRVDIVGKFGGRNRRSERMCHR